MTITGDPDQDIGLVLCASLAPVGGYAPGSYYCRCAECGQQFIGAKRAVQCFACATKPRPPVCPMIAGLNRWRARKLIESMLDARRDTSWGPGRLAAGRALVEAMLGQGPELLTLAEERIRKLERDRAYSRARRARMRAERAEVTG